MSGSRAITEEKSRDMEGVLDVSVTDGGVRTLDPVKPATKSCPCAS